MKPNQILFLIKVSFSDLRVFYFSRNINSVEVNSFGTKLNPEPSYPSISKRPLISAPSSQRIRVQKPLDYPQLLSQSRRRLSQLASLVNQATPPYSPIETVTDVMNGYAKESRDVNPHLVRAKTCVWDCVKSSNMKDWAGCKV
jgi:hypothetical protein